VGECADAGQQDLREGRNGFGEERNGVGDARKRRRRFGDVVTVEPENPRSAAPELCDGDW
jgi:hypothetical protein